MESQCENVVCPYSVSYEGKQIQIGAQVEPAAVRL